MTKVCCRCKQSKPLDLFNKNKSNPDGLNVYCRPCSLEYFARYREVNRDKIFLSGKEYRSRNADRIRVSKNEYIKSRRKSDIHFKILRNVRTYVRRVCSNNGARKSFSLTSLVTYTKDDLKLHLESHFQPGMTWDNHGTVWHIDHIRPCNSFDVATYGESAIVAMWALDNLRPAFAKDNIDKSDNYEIKDSDFYVCREWLNKQQRLRYKSPMKSGDDLENNTNSVPISN
jgi:hypothetical protein